jgi:hypothetical protein
MYDINGRCFRFFWYAQLMTEFSLLLTIMLQRVGYTSMSPAWQLEGKVTLAMLLSQSTTHWDFLTLGSSP